MNLSKIQRDIINVLKLNADQDLPFVAKKLNVTHKTVRYHLDSLTARGVVQRVNFIDVYPLGFRYVNMYFSVAASNRKAVQTMLSKLSASKKVSWLAELGGDFHYGVAFLVNSFEEVRSELEELGSIDKLVLFEKVLNVHLSLSMYHLKMLARPLSTTTDIGYGETTKKLELDETGFKLLGLLSNSPDLSLRDIAKTLGRSVSNISDRVQEFRKAKVLRGSWLQVNIESVGLSRYKLLVYSRGFVAGFADKLKLFCRQHRNVDYFIECLGEWDFEIGLIVDSHDKVMETTQEIYDQFGDAIKVVKVLPLIQILKLSQFPLLNRP